jgi:hypothetical protein
MFLGSLRLLPRIFDVCHLYLVYDEDFEHPIEYLLALQLQLCTLAYS